jgi:GAF domain
MILKLLKETFARIGADEGSIWLLDQDKQHLVATYNSGPNTAKIVGFKQPLSKGIISLVVASEQPFVENEVYNNIDHSNTLDKELHKATYSMIVVPLYFLNEVRGVISCVQLQEVEIRDGKPVPKGEKPSGFRPEDLNAIQTISAVVRDLIDYRLLGTAIGWNRL